METNKKQELYAWCVKNEKYFILEEWDKEKNEENGIHLQECSFSSKKIAWWKCKQGHSYSMPICKKTTRNFGCPVCSNHKIIKGINSFEDIHPELIEEWHPTKNIYKPYEVSPQSGKKIWWICKYNHEWQASPHDRVQSKTGCPICSSRRNTSFPEQAIFFYVRKLYPEAINRYKDIFKNGMELDVYIPSIRLGIEYDGGNWHRTEQSHKKEKTKYRICKKNNITLFRIKEGAENYWHDVADNIWYLDKRKNNDQLQMIIQSIIDSIDRESNMWTRKSPLMFQSRIKVNLEADSNEIKSYLFELKGSIADKNSDLLLDWNYEKNGSLKPEMFSSGSNDKVWWKCHICGNEWVAQINHRAGKKKSGCPECSKIKRVKLFTKNRVIQNGSLADRNPELAKEWHPTKNGFLTPNDITEGKFKSVWWLCPKCGYEWLASPNLRKRGVGCPCCAGRVPKIGINDLETIYPKIVKEWDYVKNRKEPKEYLPGSNQKVWWICENGHSWSTNIRLKIKGKAKCPYCLGKELWKGSNDLSTVRPDIAKQWDFEKNKKTPSDFSYKSKEIVWWLCEKGHSYSASIEERTRKIKEKNCPYCSNKKILIGFNDLSTTNPKIASQWDYEKNYPLTPGDVTKGKNKYVWWKCEKNHSFYSSINHRTNDNSGCPYCSNKKILIGFNDLEHNNALLAKEWNYKKNGDLKPNQFTSHSDKKVWWICSKCGNEWEAVIDKRSNGRNCPKCSDRRKKSSKI